MDDDRTWKWLCLALGCVFMWSGWQWLENLHRADVVAKNIKTLSALLSHEGELAYRAELLRIFEVNTVDVRAGDIDVALNPEGSAYDVTIRSRWTYLVPGVTEFTWPCVHTLSVRRDAILDHWGS